MKNHKAPGIDVNTAEVLKSGREPMVAMLHKILYCRLGHREVCERPGPNVSHSPLKKGDKQKPENCRAISLLSIPCKVFGRMLLNRR